MSPARSGKPAAGPQRRPASRVKGHGSRPTARNVPSPEPRAPLPGLLRFDERGLVPAIVQDADSGAVLMLGYMDSEALAATLGSGEVHFHSRSRGTLWRKGETSGNVLRLTGIVADCDGDALLVLARPAGPTCHTGHVTCFHMAVAGRGARGAGLEQEDRAAPRQGGLTLAPLFAVLADRAARRPDGSYTVKLLDDEDRALKKLIEEAGEVALAVKNRDRANLVWEVADVLYHLAVIMVAQGVAPGEVNDELARRAGKAE